MARRPTTKQRGYGGSWRRFSLAVRRAHPYCAECGATSDLTVDHLDERDDSTSIRSTALDRVRVLCRACNSRRQATRNAARGVGRKPTRTRGGSGRSVATRGVLADPSVF